MTITEKDKKLLIVAGIFLVIVALLLFVVKPGFTSFNENKTKIETLKPQKENMEKEINSLSTYEAQLSAAIEEYNATAARVFGDLTNDKIQDTVVDGFVTPCGLTTTDFTISGVGKIGVSGYAVTTNEDGTITGVGGTTSDNANVRLANITISVSGTNAQVISLLDKLNSTEGIFLQQTSLATATDNGAVSISFYMVLSETFA